MSRVHAWASGTLAAVGLLLLSSRSMGAEETASLQGKTWTWGYVIPGVPPGDVPFVGKSTCSLEAGASMLGTPNVVYMNSNHNRKTLSPDCLDRIVGCKQILCALQHGAYRETARDVSVLSKRRKSIVGGLIDDFRDYHGPSKSITPDETRAIHEALKSENPALKLYVVRYTWQDQKDLVPFLPYFDAINLWVWKGEEKPWRETLEPEIDHIREITKKPILLGLFIHDYGGTGKALAMNIQKLQFEKATELVKKGKIEGFVILQSGWFHHEDHRPQVEWLKKYLDTQFRSDVVRQ